MDAGADAARALGEFVRPGLRDGSSSGDHRVASAVLDDHGLPEFVHQPGCDGPCNEVDAPAGGDRNDDAHRLRRQRGRLATRGERDGQGRREQPMIRQGISSSISMPSAP
ncbi:MAG: hypothetical protein ACK52M_20210 [bacterium]|jgi:hypothetical protein|nr:hypothetical protein [Betaproteobacteria bacterium]